MKCAGGPRAHLVAHRNGIRLLKLVNSLLDFSRIRPADPGEFRGGGSLSLHRRARLDFPLGRRARRPQPAGRLSAAARAGACRSRHVGKGRPQPPVQRVEVHLRRRDCGCNPADGRWQGGRDRRARYRHRHTGRRAAAPVRALPSRRGHARPEHRRQRHRPGVGAGAGPPSGRHDFRGKRDRGR